LKTKICQATKRFSPSDSCRRRRTLFSPLFPLGRGRILFSPPFPLGRGEIKRGDGKIKRYLPLQRRGRKLNSAFSL